MHRSLYVPLLALIVLGCRTQNNERYCDPATPCASAAYPYCDLDKNECQAAAPSEDLATAMDLSAEVVDAAAVDLPAVDLPVVIDGAEADAAPPGCSVAADCPSPAPICDPTTGACRACNARSDDAQCVMHSAATPHCRQPKALGPNTGTCVQCNSDTDCNQALAPICDATGICRGCLLHGECASAVCITDTGLCADSNDVAYVDNGNNSVSDCHKSGLHDGAPAHPYCDIVDGIQAGNPYLRVTGHLNAPYSPLAFSSSTSLIIVGPGAGVANPATIGDNNATDVSVMLSGGSVNLILDGMELGSRNMGSNGQGLLCSISGAGTTASVTLRNDTVQHANNTGVSSTSCTLVISNSIITNNGNSGLSINGGKATVSGTTFSNNSGPAAINLGGTLVDTTFTGNTINGNSLAANTTPGVLVNGSMTSVTFTGNTIANHGGDAVDCSGGSNTTLNGNTISKCKQGVSSNGATITLDSNRIFGMLGTGAFGVDAENSTFTVTNNFIYGNPGPGMKMSMTSTGKFSLNTVVENGGGGVDCGGGTTQKPIEASIVWGNQLTGGSQFLGNNCELLSTVTGPDNLARAIQLVPAFVNPSPSPGPIDLHLKAAAAGNTACCFDKIGGTLDGGTPLPDHDIDAEHRPRGAGYDVGADEAQ